MKMLYKWFVNALAVLVAAYFVPGVEVDSLAIAFIVALVFGIINVTLKPALKILTLPLNIATLGLFGLLVNTVLVLFADTLVDGFSVDTFFTALIFSFILGLVNWVASIFK